MAAQTGGQCTTSVPPAKKEMLLLKQKTKTKEEMKSSVKFSPLCARTHRPRETTQTLHEICANNNQQQQLLTQVWIPNPDPFEVWGRKCSGGKVMGIVFFKRKDKAHVT